MRNEQAYRLDAMNGLASLAKGSCILIAFDFPLDIPVMPGTVQKSLDILFVNEQGAILQIMPEVILADLHKEVYANKPVKALIYLNGGEVKAHGIQPGWVVSHALFQPDPTVMR